MFCGREALSPNKLQAASRAQLPFGGEGKAINGKEWVGNVCVPVELLIALC